MSHESQTRLVFLSIPVLLLGIIVSLTPIGPTDYWWHLALGKITAETGSPLFSNLFLYTLPPDALFIDLPWLAELALFKWFEATGHLGVKLMTHTIAVGTWGIITYWGWIRSRDLRITTVWSILLATTVFGIYEPRTRIFVLPVFLYLLWTIVHVIENDGSRGWLWSNVFLTLLWGNLHGSFVLTPLLLTAAFGGYLTERWLKNDFDWNLFFHAAAVLGLCLLAVGLHPAGIFEIYRHYVMRIVGSFGVASPVNEWKSLMLDRADHWVIITVMAGTGLALYRSRNSVRLHELALIGTGIVLEIKAVRMAYWWASITVIFVPRYLRLCFEWSWLGESRPPRILRLVAAMTSAILLAGFIAVQPGLPRSVKRLDFIRSTFRQNGEGAGVLDESNPIELVHYLKTHGANGCIFHDQRVAGLIEFRLGSDFPNVRPTVFVDQRMTLPTDEIWSDYWRLSKAYPEWQHIIQKWNIGTLILSKVEDDQIALAERLRYQRQWQKVSQTETHVLFVSREQKPKCSALPNRDR